MDCRSDWKAKKKERLEEMPLKTADPSSLNNIANNYFSLGEPSKALPLLEESLAIRRKTLPPDHPYIALSLKNIATTQQNPFP